MAYGETITNILNNTFGAAQKFDSAEQAETAIACLSGIRIRNGKVIKRDGEVYAMGFRYVSGAPVWL